MSCTSRPRTVAEGASSRDFEPPRRGLRSRCWCHVTGSKGSPAGYDAAVRTDGRDAQADELSKLYRDRFGDDDLAFKRAVWGILCARVFQRYVRPEDTVLDLGAGSCEFINAIRCTRKIAVDLNPDTAQHAQEATVLQVPSTDMHPVESASVDVVFSSNFFEHLPTKDDVLTTLREVHRVLRPEGTLMVLQPNIRYLAGRYWDYFDHHTPLTHVSMEEALRLTGFVPERVVPRFLPYTVKGTRIRSTLLVRLYLRLRFLWPLLGRQMFIVARPG